MSPLALYCELTLRAGIKTANPTAYPTANRGALNIIPTSLSGTEYHISPTGELINQKRIADSTGRELTNEVDHDGASEQDRDEDQDPGEVRCLESEQPKEVVADVRIPSAPNVDDHGGQRLSQEDHPHCKGGYDLTHWMSR